MDWSRVIFIKDDYKTDKFPSEYELDDEESDRHSPPFKAKSCIIMHHMDGTKHKRMSWVRTQYMGNIRTENWLMLSISNVCALAINQVKSQWFNLAKFTILQSLSVAVPLSSYFDTQSFTVLALNNSGNANRSSISERKHAHDAFTTIFQIITSTMKSKPTRVLLTHQLSKILRNLNIKR